tara:strand:- start:375 stop:524 length:150 start_codon:yes stop_codon:yes gene_type:complete
MVVLVAVQVLMHKGIPQVVVVLVTHHQQVHHKVMLVVMVEPEIGQVLLM